MVILTDTQGHYYIDIHEDCPTLLYNSWPLLFISISPSQCPAGAAHARTVLRLARFVSLSGGREGGREGGRVL